MPTKKATQSRPVAMHTSPMFSKEALDRMKKDPHYIALPVPKWVNSFGKFNKYIQRTYGIWVNLDRGSEMEMDIFYHSDMRSLIGYLEWLHDGHYADVILYDANGGYYKKFKPESYAKLMRNVEAYKKVLAAVKKGK